MQPDDEVCLCYHVSLRKLVNYARRVRPRHASQMTACLGAGTGCGWCIPILQRIAADASRTPDAPAAQTPASAPADPSLDVGMSREEYAAARRAYHREPGARHRFDEESPEERQ